MKSQAIKKLTLSAMFLALGLVLPFLTGQIPQIGKMLLPMHIPAFLCGLICGWQYGLVVGFIMPLMRSLIFAMPVLYPVAAAMAVELAVYGFVSGFLFNLLRKKNILSLYISMLSAMILGRIVWGIAELILLGVRGNTFTWQMFMAGAVLDAVPGIILQLFLIPSIMLTLDKTGIVKFTKENKQTTGF